ncbi:hypothetical protein P152DRAFT_391390 [Eremomyces bilateralis CBS 781.70]|uniref:PH domain-containing protein n=1 Tax=Eremomyces bilateralis CBS 781.70 TaxID=1392243 RepID=A0A6G1GAX2_9PEZI|nr:uncharacterized protein P152DRAFT_391390 [Eremomyces bilateralis CBS 781.70]KAF1815183.1 hypothetical protein P152DRAFT_391390 [Eremomyces bilateralis CBS 781.70]
MATSISSQQVVDAEQSHAGASPSPKRKPKLSRVQTFNNSVSQGIDVFSPVNENGSFEFDRIIKAGDRQTWKPMYLILRPHTMSLYKDAEGTKLRFQLKLSDITAIARQKDPKGKAEHVFGVFSSARTVHLAAKTDKEVTDWVNLIRQGARIDEADDELDILQSPSEDTGPNPTFGNWTMDSAMDRGRTPLGVQQPAAMASSSSEPEGMPVPSRKPGELHSAAAASRKTGYSGNDMSVSDLSDIGGSIRPDGVPLSLSKSREGSHPEAQRALSSTSITGQGASVPEGSEDRIIYQGWLHLLKTKGGVRQWKRLWSVLRPRNCAFYKSEEEYSAVLILPLSSLVSAVEIDPVSKSRPYCMQLIADDRNYRFAAPSEEKLAAWLGAFLSLFAKRKQGWKRESQLESGQLEDVVDGNRSRRTTAEVKENTPGGGEGRGDGQAMNRQTKAHNSMSTIASSRVGLDDSAPVAVSGK